MILALVLVAVLVLVALTVSYLNLKAAQAHVQAADALVASTDQLVDSLAEVHLDHQEQVAALHEVAKSLDNHQSEMQAMADQQVALRKQVKALLRGASTAVAQADRILAKEYAQQKDVDDILYWVRKERGELNG